MPAPDYRRRLTAFLVALAVLIATPLAVVAADAFTDVPDTNVFHEDIAWLRDAGVTKGCNPPANTEFCPSDNVTREQMAAFMRRLSESKVVDAATAVTAETAGHATSADSATTADNAGDADTLDGKDATAFVEKGEADSVDRDMTVHEPGLASTYVDGLTPVSATTTSYAEVTITVPDSGFVYLTASTYFDTDHLTATSPDAPRASISDSPTTMNFNSFQFCMTIPALPSGLYRCSISLTAVEPVEAGTHTYYLVADRVFESQADANTIARRTLTAMYFPTAYGFVSRNFP
jgi:hypothetical protein